MLQKSSFGSGINKLASTFKQWGTTLVAKKDDFKEWVYQYLSPEGFKSGAVALYTKLYEWATIVYEWFRDKFLKFIENIPKMVENWKSLRLSLFKWGTFLVGGGGSALWSMFGSFDDIGKLADLMGNEDFMAAAEKFAELVEENSEEFGKMSEEEMKEIFQKMIDDPEESKKIAEELLEEQKQENKDKKEEEKKEIDKEKLYESFAQPKGKPKDEGEVLGYLIGDALKKVMNASFDTHIQSAAKKAMEAYFDEIVKNSEKKTKAGKANKDFLTAIGEQKNDLINDFASLVEKAFTISGDSKDFNTLSKAFESAMKAKYTTPILGDQQEGEEANLDNFIREPVPIKKK